MKKTLSNAAAFYFLGKQAMIDRSKRCYREDGPEALKAAKEKEMNEFLEKVKATASAEIATKVKELTDKLSAIEGKDADTAKIVEALKNNIAVAEADLKAFKEKGNLSPVAQTIKGQIKKLYEEKATELANFKNKKSDGFSMDLDLKAAITMLESASLNGSAYVPNPDIRPGYIDLVRNMPLIEQYANGGATSSQLMVWVSKYNAQGTAATTAEGAALPLVSNEVKTENTTAVLIGAYITISIQMLDDIDFMAAMIEQELTYQVNIKVDNELLTATGGGDLNGIENYAVGYTNTSIATTDANNFDAIRAVQGQMESLNFYPTHVFVNPTDAANMDLVKDLYGRPIAKEYKNLWADGSESVSGMKFIKSPQIAAGYVLVADMTKFWVFQYLPFTVQYGWINDNLIKNLITVTGIRRLHSYVSLNHLNGFVYSSFATIKLAIAPTP